MPSIHNDWITRKALIQYRGATPPNPAKYFMCLADTDLLTRASTKAEFFAAELRAQNGYQRAAIVFDSDGTYSNINKRHEMPEVTGIFTATDAALQFQTIFLIADGHANSTKTLTPANVNATDNVITIASHGLSIGDEIMFEVGFGSTLPGVTAGVVYQAIAVSGDSFQVSTNGASAVDLSAGSGAFYLRYANGKIHNLHVEPESQLIQAGKSGDIYLRLSEANDAFGVGV